MARTRLHSCIKSPKVQAAVGRTEMASPPPQYAAGVPEIQLTEQRDESALCMGFPTARCSRRSLHSATVEPEGTCAATVAESPMGCLVASPSTQTP